MNLAHRLRALVRRPHPAPTTDAGLCIDWVGETVAEHTPGRRTGICLRCGTLTRPTPPGEHPAPTTGQTWDRIAEPGVFAVITRMWRGKDGGPLVVFDIHGQRNADGSPYVSHSAMPLTAFTDRYRLADEGSQW